MLPIIGRLRTTTLKKFKSWIYILLILRSLTQFRERIPVERNPTRTKADFDLMRRVRVRNLGLGLG